MNLNIEHSCGHSQVHNIGVVAGSLENVKAYYRNKPCDHCRPMCAYCHRVGPREKMLFENDKAFCGEWCRNEYHNPTHYAEHNNTTIPAFLQGNGWIDASWHNDLCAKSHLVLSDRSVIQVWVAQDNVQDREWDDMPTFTISTFPNEDLDSDFQKEVWEGNDPIEAQKVIETLTGATK